MPESLYYEDWVIGDLFETRPRLVTQNDIDHFGEVEGHKGPLHNDPDAAKKSVFGDITVHGVLPIAMSFGMMGAMGLYDHSALAFLELNWKYHAPIRMGDTLRARWCVKDRRPTSKPGRGIIVREIKILNQDDVICCSGELTSLWAFRPQSS